MGAKEHLQATIDEQISRLRATVPAAREAALLSVLQGIGNPPSIPAPPDPDPITGHRLPALGAGLALQLCLEARRDGLPDTGGLPTWADRFLAACADVAASELVLRHAETGFMRLVEQPDGEFDAWVATKVIAPSWRERADIDWWAAWLAARHRSEGDPPGGDTPRYDVEAGVRLAAMAYQLAIPPDSPLGGISVRTWIDALRALIAVALEARDRGESPAVRTEPALAAVLGDRAGLARDQAATVLASLTVDGTNAGWHAAAPGVAFPPLVRLDGERVALSVHGLLTEPLFFLGRELRRREPEAYHNAAAAREDAFRLDLKGLFGDRRFVTASRRVVLRRDDGKARTDVDAAVFDRKTGTLGLFELKSQEPFARAPAELGRQRDNLLYANRQLSGLLDWINRHGADEILSRIDRDASKRFRVRKVYPFVLGRYLAHFPDGPAPDRRAAWGTWPQVLRLLDAQAFEAKGANPIASLFTRLGRDSPPLAPPADMPPREIRLGDTRLTVWGSYAGYREAGP